MFHALADRSRRAMVEHLVRGPASVSELARPFTMSLPAVAQHLAVLESAGIVTSEKVGRVRTYQLAADALTPCADWVGRQRLPTERRLDRLAEFLQRDTPTPTPEECAPRPASPACSGGVRTAAAWSTGTTRTGTTGSTPGCRPGGHERRRPRPVGRAGPGCAAPPLRWGQVGALLVRLPSGAWAAREARQRRT